RSLPLAAFFQGLTLLRAAFVRGLLVGAVLALLLAVTRSAGASELSALERSLVKETLDERKLELDPEPEDKWIESVDVRRVEVFDKRDPVPDFVNVFHTTSREAVIRHEILFAPGERYTQAKADEIARNLRLHTQLSVV